MPLDEKLADRLRFSLGPEPGLSERKMFGGLCVMLRGNMLCGTTGPDYMFRVGAEREAEALTHTHARPCDFTGRRMTGIVMADAGKLAADDFDALMRLSLDFVSSLPAKG